MILTIIFIVLFLISVTANVILLAYARHILKTTFVSSEIITEIFTRMDAFKKHIKTIYELEMFYGDRNLRDILEHTQDFISFIKKFEGIYSFNHPNLEDILKEEEELEDDGKEREVQKVFHPRT